MLQLIDLVFNKHNDCATNKPPYRMPVLTPRELQVLSAIAQGVQPGRLARQLGLHVKTISSHKCTAMRKLGFSRNHELYHWLSRQGGLVKNPINTRGSAPVTVPMNPSGKDHQAFTLRQDLLAHEQQLARQRVELESLRQEVTALRKGKLSLPVVNAPIMSDQQQLQQWVVGLGDA